VYVCMYMCVDSREDRLMSLLSTITAVSGVCRCGCGCGCGCFGVWVCMDVCV